MSWSASQHLILSCIFCLKTPKAGSVPRNWWKFFCLASPSAISFSHIQEYMGSQQSPAEWWVEMSCNASWPCRTNGDVVWAACRAFKAAWLPEQILMCFYGLEFLWISCAQTKKAYISESQAVAYLPKEMVRLLPKDCFYTTPSPLAFPVSISIPNEPFIWWKCPTSSGPFFCSQHDNIILGFKVTCWSHIIVSHTKYGIRSLKPYQHTAVS
jgi:hypothetical protein